MTGSAYPTMRPESADYTLPGGYEAKIMQQGATLNVTHCLTNVNCLPAQWLRDDLADLCCEVRIPQMLYSEPFVANRADMQFPSMPPWEYTQSLSLPQTGPYSSLYFLPAIVLRDKRHEKLDTRTHGVSPIWNGRDVVFPKGAILAGGFVEKDVENVFNLVRFEEDGEGVPGVISSASWNESECVFSVRIPSGELYDATQFMQHIPWFDSLYVTCLNQMLNAFREIYEYRDEEVHPPEAVKELGEMIREATHKAPPWDEGYDNDWDDTLHLATVLHNLRAPTTVEDEE